MLTKDEQVRDATVRGARAPLALITDDDPSVLDSLGRALGALGWESVAVESGRAALETMEAGKFDLIFLDLIMPEVNGVTVFREVRRIDPSAKVVIITGYPDSALISEALRIGPFTVMRKPFGLHELGMVLDTVPTRTSTRSIS